MRKLISLLGVAALAAVSILLAMPAHGQPVLADRSAPLTPAPAAPPPAWPAPIDATSSLPTVRADAAGFAVVWAYRTDFAAGKYGFWGRWDQMVDGWQALMYEGITGSDAARETLWRAHVTQPGLVYDASLAGVVPAAWEATPVLAAPVWQVARNSSYRDRPAYPFAGGVRGTKSTERAAVDGACSCATRSVEGSSVYCGVLGRTDLVALCRRAD